MPQWKVPHAATKTWYSQINKKIIPWTEEPGRLQSMERQRVDMIEQLNMQVQVLWLILVNYNTLGSTGNLCVGSQLIRSMGDLKTLEFSSGFWCGGRIMLLTCQMWPNSRYLALLSPAPQTTGSRHCPKVTEGEPRTKLTSKADWAPL